MDYDEFLRLVEIHMYQFLSHHVQLIAENYTGVNVT